METEIILKDEEISVLLPFKAITNGHLIIIPNKPAMIMEQVEDSVLAKMFQVANKLSSALFDNLGCQGTNILIQNGVPAGQTNEIFSISVIPRFEKDELNMEWKPKQASAEELDLVVERYKGIENEESEKKLVIEKKEKAENKEENIIKHNKDNYLIKSLNRQP